MSLARRIIVFPITRLVITLIVFGLLTFLFSLIFAITSLPEPALLSELIVTLAVLGALALVARLIERRSLAEVGFAPAGAGRELLLGFLVGAGLLCLIAGLLAIAGWYRVVGWGWATADAVALGLLRALVLYFLVAVFEETLFRGIIFRGIEDVFGSWAALVTSALLFGLAHLANPNASLVAGIAIALEAGVMLGAAYMLTRRLWLAIGLHWAWNFFEGPIFGTPVSGGAQLGLLRSILAGPELWTGGAFGPEAGLVAVLVCTAAGIVFLLLAVQRGQVRPPIWKRRAAEAHVSVA